jgi:WD40 repeat protein
MFSTKAMIGTFLLLGVGVVGSGVGAVAYHQVTSNATEARQEARGQRPSAEPSVRTQTGAAKADNTLWKEKAVFETPGWLPGSVAYSSDGKLLVIGGTDGKVIALNPATRKEKWKAEVGGNLAAAAFTADGKSILATINDGVRFLDALSGKLGASLEQKDSHPTAVGVFPDKDVIAPGNQRFTSHKVIFANARGCFVKVWNDSAAPSTAATITVPKHKNPVDPSAVPLAVDPDGRKAIVTGPMDGNTGKNVLWAWVAGDYEEGTSGNRLLNGHQAVVVSAAWSKDGKTAVTGDASGRVIVWDAKTMKESQRLELGGRIAAVALSTDGKNIAAVAIGKQAEFYVWETTKPKNLKPIYTDSSDFSGPATIHACLAFSPDGRQLAGSAFSAAWLSRAGDLVGKLHVWGTDKLAIESVQASGPIIEVTASYPDANAQAVAETVAAPIEQQINGVEGLLWIESESGNDGSYISRLRFEPKANPERVAQLVRDRVALATPVLPDQVQRAGVRVKVGTAERNEKQVAIALIDSADNGREALQRWSTVVMRRLSEDGVAVLPKAFPGPDEKQIVVQIDRAKCVQLGVSTVNVLNAARPAVKAANIDTLKKLKVSSAKGDQIPIESVAAFKELTGPKALYRVNLYPAMRITGSPPEGKTAIDAAATWMRLAEVERPMSSFRLVNLTEE